MLTQGGVQVSLLSQAAGPQGSTIFTFGSITVPGPKSPGLYSPGLVFALIVIIKMVTVAP